jgi:oligoendopeptidase F
MAEINIQKKKRPIWPWILGILVIVAAIILLGRDDTRKEAEQAVAPITNGDSEVPEEISEYVAFVRTSDTEQQMEIDHNYTAEGLQRLASALDALVSDTETDNMNMDDRKNRIEEVANYIQQDPHAGTHADSIRAAFMVASEVIEAVQRQNFPNLSGEAQSVRSAAQGIDPNTLTLEQTENVKRFFDESASALNEMAKRWNGNGNGNRNQRN